MTRKEQIDEQGWLLIKNVFTKSCSLDFPLLASWKLTNNFFLKSSINRKYLYI